eukprot:3995769-Amphidinium_carterae.1
MQCLTKPESFTIPVVKGKRGTALSEPSPVKDKRKGKGKRRLSDASTNAKTHWSDTKDKTIKQAQSPSRGMASGLGRRAATLERCSCPRGRGPGLG